MSFKVCQILNAQKSISSGERVTSRWAVNQRIEPSQPHLFNQTFIFFDYFWSFEFSQLRATIMPFKVCEIVSAQKLIRAGEGDDSWKIEQSKPSIFPISFAESNLHIFPLFLNCWTHLDWLYNLVTESASSESIFAKFEAGDRLIERQMTQRIMSGIKGGGKSVRASNIPNLNYYVKPSYFSIIFKALNSANSELQSRLSKYVRYSVREVHLQSKSSCQTKNLMIQRFEIFPTSFVENVENREWYCYLCD